MFIARFQMPDGKIGRFEVPEGTTPEAAHAQIEQMMSQQQAAAPQEAMPEPQAPTQTPNVDTDLWSKLEQQESGGRQSAVSPKGAIGVAQVMPGTAPEAAALAGLTFDEARYKGDADYNRKLGQAYLGKQMKDFGEPRLALAAYNAGPGRVAETLKSVGDPRTGQVSWGQFMAALPEETQNYVRKIAGPSSVGEGIAADFKEGGRIAATGIKGGLGAVPRMLQEGLSSASQWGEVAADKLGVPSIPGLRDLPAPTDLLKSGIDYLTKPRDYEVPETREGKGAARILSSTIAGVMSPGSIPMNLAAGFTGGVGAEIGNELSGGSPAGAIGGGLAGSVIPAVLSKGRSIVGTPSTTKAKLASLGLDNVSDVQLAIAKERMQIAKTQGVDLTLPQAMPSESNLDTLQDMFVKMKSGEPLAAQLRAQPQQVVDASQAAAATLPGEVKGAQEIANQGQKAASDAFRQIKAERTAAVTPAYQSSGKISIDDVGPMYGSLRQAIKASGATDRGKTLTKLYNKLNPMKSVQQADGSIKKVRKPVTDVQLIDDTLRELEKKMSNKPKDPRAAALIQSEVGRIRETLGNLSQGYREGAQQYAQITKDVVNPAKQGPLGTVAGKAGYAADTAASRSNLYGIFDRGTAEGGRSEILTLQRDMAKAGAEGNKAFTDAGTSWFADKLESAYKFTDNDQFHPDTANRIKDAFFGSPAQSRGTRDVLAGIAKSQGQPEDVFVKGLENWAQTIKSASKRPSTTRGQSPGEVTKGTETLASKLASTTVLAPIRRPLERLDEWINKDAYTYISKLMQTPEGVDTLKKLARSEPGSSAAQTALARFNATIAAEQAAQDEE